jgi:hypothetical protein
MKTGIFAVCLMAIGLSGCSATVPMADPGASSAGQAFQAPPLGQGALYIYRHGGLGLSQLVTATIGQRTLGQLAANTWFRIDLDPGSQQLRCTTAEASEALQVQVGAAEIRFVEVAIRIGLAAPRCAISEVSPEKGQAAIRAGRRAMPQ